jgi:peroxiredoxin
VTIETGAHAPDFNLKDEHGQLIRLADLRGEKHVALVFYPFAFSGTCTGELCEIRDNLAAFQDRKVQVLAVSCDPIFSLRAWSDAEGFTFPLLSDFWPHGGTARAYGVFNEAVGAATRGTFLIDDAGVVRWSVVNGLGDARSLSEYRDAIAAL